MPLTKEALLALGDHDLLDRIIEESAELIQACMKAKRFGPHDIDPRKPDADQNVFAIGLEYAQVSNGVATYCERYGITAGYIKTLDRQRAEEQERNMQRLGYRKGQ